jgi:hypothetical protein
MATSPARSGGGKSVKKPTSLRTHLQQWVPDLARHPDKLLMFINKGRVSCQFGTNLSYEQHYQLEIIVTDFGEPTDVLNIPLLIWISEHQPDILLSPEAKARAIEFEADIIDADKADVRITMELSERVIVQPAAGGGYTCTHVDEPPLPDLTGPNGWQIYLKGELIADGNAE